MHILNTFADMTWQEAETVQLAGEAYAWLVIAIPVMLAFMLIILFMINLAIFGMSGRLIEIKRLLEDVFEDKLDALDESDKSHKQEVRAAKMSAREERKMLREPMSKSRKITLGILVGSIPVLLVILVAMLM